MAPRNLQLPLCAVALVSHVVPAVAFPQFQRQIPNGDKVMRNDVAWPGVGHKSSFGGDARNAFGLDFFAAGKKWTVELCQMDSDGDNQTNGFELGDPDCVWAVGKTPARNHDISHPGFADSTSDADPDWVQPPCIAREQVVYTGCGLTFEREADRDTYCGAGQGSTGTFIPSEGAANPSGGDPSCSLEVFATVYVGCGYIFQSALNRRETCGPGPWTTRDTSNFIPSLGGLPPSGLASAGLMCAEEGSRWGAETAEQIAQVACSGTLSR